MSDEVEIKMPDVNFSVTSASSRLKCHDFAFNRGRPRFCPISNWFCLSVLQPNASPDPSIFADVKEVSTCPGHLAVSLCEAK
jgi:hypothetical protein